MITEKRKEMERFPYTRIVRSCITGKVVWIYRGASKAAAKMAYWRACKKEIRRVRNWAAAVARRKNAVTRLQTALTDGMPIGADLSPEQRTAAKDLQGIARQEKSCHRDFYEHIMEERRRRKHDGEIRRKMREREKSQEPVL